MGESLAGGIRAKSQNRLRAQSFLMRETDGRKQTQAEQEIHRRQAARLLRAGRTPEQVAEALGRSRAWAFSVQKTLREDGENALRAKPRPEGPKKLSKKQRAELAVLIEDHTPMDYGFDEALWTRRIVGDLIYDRWGVDLSEPTVGAVLREIGFSPQRTSRRT